MTIGCFLREIEVNTLIVVRQKQSGEVVPLGGGFADKISKYFGLREIRRIDAVEGVLFILVN